MKLLRRQAEQRKTSLNQFCISFLEGAALPNVASLEKLQISGDFSSKIMRFVTDAISPVFTEQIVGVVLFGSAARGTMQESSDIDLLIVLRSGVVIERDLYDRIPFHSITGHSVSPALVALPHSTEEALRSLWLEVAIDGCIIFDTDFQLSRLLMSVRSEIVSGTVKRQVAYGVPYWVRSTELLSQDVCQ